MTLNSRERFLVMIGMGVIAFLLIFLSVRGIRRVFKNLEQEKMKVEKERAELLNAYNEYNKLRSFQSVSSQSLDNLVPFLEQKLQAYALKNNISNMVPSEAAVGKKFLKKSVSMNFRETPAAPVLTLIQDIERSKDHAYRVDKFVSREVLKKDGLYNITLRITGFAKK